MSVIYDKSIVLTPAMSSIGILFCFEITGSPEPHEIGIVVDWSNCHVRQDDKVSAVTDATTIVYEVQSVMRAPNGAPVILNTDRSRGRDVFAIEHIASPAIIRVTPIDATLNGKPAAIEGIPSIVVVADSGCNIRSSEVPTFVVQPR